jgi:hypothetical protein
LAEEKRRNRAARLAQEKEPSEWLAVRLEQPFWPSAGEASPLKRVAKVIPADAWPERQPPPFFNIREVSTFEQIGSEFISDNLWQRGKPRHLPGITEPVESG